MAEQLGIHKQTMRQYLTLKGYPTYAGRHHKVTRPPRAKSLGKRPDSFGQPQAHPVIIQYGPWGRWEGRSWRSGVVGMYQARAFTDEDMKGFLDRLRQNLMLGLGRPSEEPRIFVPVKRGQPL